MAATKTKNFRVIWDKYFILFVVLICFLVLILGIYFIFGDQIKLMNNSSKEIRILEQSIENSSTTLAQLQEEAKVISPMSAEDQVVINQALPKDFDITNFIQEIQAISLEKGVLIKKIETATNIPHGNNGIKKSEINMTISAPGYDIFKRYLEMIEESRMYLDISSLTFSNDTQNYDLKINAYYYP